MLRRASRGIPSIWSKCLSKSLSRRCNQWIIIKKDVSLFIIQGLNLESTKREKRKHFSPFIALHPITQKWCAIKKKPSMIVIRSIIEKGGPGQITCNYHTIPIRWHVLFLICFLWLSEVDTRLCTFVLLFTLSSSRTFSIILSLSFSLSFSLLRIPTSDNSGRRA